MSSVKSRILQFQNQSPIETVSANINGTSPSSTNTTDLHQNFKNNLYRKNSHSHSNSNSVSILNNMSNHDTHTNCEETPPPKPPLNLSAKKTSLNINLSGNTSTPNVTNVTTTNNTSNHEVHMRRPQQNQQHCPSPTKPTAGIRPTLNTKSSIVLSSSIPKLVSPGNGQSFATNGSGIGIGIGNAKLYGIDWKEKFEESEKKRTHFVTLAQKATRDFEELRRRYKDVYTENEKLVQKLNNSNVQLDKLRKAAEGTYDEYYKLKKKYQVENTAKSDALVRVDQYNKENRRLKRQSQVLMEQMNDSNFTLDDIVEASAENPENDKEILFLRNHVQELESRIVDLESELEKTKLAEFETQESVLLMNDTVHTSKSEKSNLLQKIKQLENEKADLKSTVEELTFELDSIKTEDSFQAEKLHMTESELLKVTTEKKVLQRQSMVFMSNTTDTQLMDALKQISELQFSVEEQKLNYESQILELQDRLNDQTSEIETTKIGIDSKIKTLEAQVDSLRLRAEEAEKNSANNHNIPEIICAPAPPPPPMPSNFGGGPPPPPLPPGGLGDGLSSSLGASLKSATLRRAVVAGSIGNGNSESSSGTTSPLNGSPNASPQIDDVISQLKKGIKLRPMDKTLNRKQTEPLEKQGEEPAVEEMRSILNNLKRTRRI